MKKDYHIHADFSADSRLKLTELIPYAIQLGYGEIAITEHLDLLPQELTIHGIPSLVKYKLTIQQLQKQYPQLKLICGIEVGDFQDVKTFAEPILQHMNFDLVLGSVHFIRNHINVAIPIKETLTKSDILEYYERNLILVETCEVDVLAHLGVYKRYYQSMPDEEHCLTVIKQIYEVMIAKNIALELNLACLRKPYKSLIPELPYLELYHKLGGKLVTIGSDSHEMSHLDFGYDIAQDVINQFSFEHLSLIK